jgi:methyltransferase (TIGR00027 family)
MTDTLIEHVSDTAFWVAHYRALETERPDALFHDPLARILAGDRGKKIAHTMPMPLMTGWTVVIRTCIIDDYIRLAVAQGVDTVLNLGAGLDTRPYRMDLPESLVWVEADYPHVIEFKENRLSSEKPRCRLERVKLDLANLSERRQILARIDARAKKMLILTEGVVPYLSIEEAGSLADDLSRLDRACYWIVDYFSPEVIKYRRRRGMQRRMQNAPFKFTPEDWYGFFGEHGWRSKEIRYLADEGDRLERPIRLPLLPKIILKMRALFTSKERRVAFRKFAGYVLLEPLTMVPSRGTFESAYAGNAPWDIGKPQQAFQAAADRVIGSVLDPGCGTGENALFFAARGHVVTAFDFLEEPLIAARRKAAERGLAATFLVKDALKLQQWTERFDNICDSGLFHVFSDEDRVQYLQGLKTVLKFEGHLFLLCFSDQTPGTQGPRRVSKDELRDAFGEGWEIESIEAARFEVRPELRQTRFSGDDPKALFMIARRVA